MRKGLLRKIIIVITTTFVSLSTIGCGLGRSKKVTTIPVDDPFSMKQLKNQTLTFYFPGYEPDGNKKVLGQIEKEVKDTLNIKLDFKWIPQGAYINKIKYLMDTDRPLDAFVLTKDEMKDEFADMGNEQRLLDLSSLIKTDAPQLSELSTKEEKTNLTYNGNLAGIPHPYRSSKRVCAVVKTDNLKKSGVTEIKNYDDYENFLSAANLSTTFNLTTIDMFAEINGYNSIGNSLVFRKNDPEMKLIPWEQTDAFKTAIKTLNSWKSKGYANNRIKDNLEVTPIADIQNGWAKSILVPWDELKNKIYFEELYDSTIRAFPLYQEMSIDLNTNVTAIAISKKSKNAERVLKFIEWIETKQDNYDLFMYGIKNENYVLNGDYVKFLENKQKYFGWNGSQAFLNDNFLHPIESGKELMDSSIMKSLDIDSKYPTTLGFIPDKSSIQSLLGKRDSDYKDFLDKLDNGILNPEEDINAFITQQQQNGIDRVLSVLQEQLNQWKSKQENSK